MSTNKPISAHSLLRRQKENLQINENEIEKLEAKLESLKNEIEKLKAVINVNTCDN